MFLLKIFLTFFLAKNISAQIGGTTPVPLCKCEVSIYQRTKCPQAPANVTPQGCAALGCCYDAILHRVFFFSVAPKCFRATGDCALAKCDIQPAQRVHCDNVYKYACERKGCCFDYRSSPQCYRSKAQISGPAGEQPALQVPTTTVSGRLELYFWSAWGPWAACSLSCSAGSRLRQRQCLRGSRPVLPRFCGQTFATESEPCNAELCSAWGAWSVSGTCSVTCGGEGTINIIRRCIGSGSSGNDSCSSQTRRCTSRIACPQIPVATWGQWEPWSVCSSNCSPGVIHRTRTCLRNNVEVNGNQCSRQGFFIGAVRTQGWETRRCNTYLCIYWTPFSTPRPCPTTCGVDATQVSRRRCWLGGSARSEAELVHFARCSIVRQSCPRIDCPTTPRVESVTPRFVFPVSLPSTTTQTKTTATTIRPTTTQTTTPTTTTTTQPTSTTTQPATTIVPTTTTITQPTTTITQPTTTITQPTTAIEPTTTMAKATTTTTMAKTTTTTTTTQPTTTSIPATAAVTITTTPNTKTETPTQTTSFEGRVTVFPGVEVSSTQSPSTTSTSMITTELTSVTASSSSTRYTWSGWSPCSRSCGPGLQTRFKRCFNENGQDISHNSPECGMGRTRQQQRCNTDMCPMWASWGPTFCLEDCEIVNNRLKTTTRELTRDCKTAVANKGDAKCYTKSLICTSYCPEPTLTSQWAGWGQWSGCSESCGTGSRTRTRVCPVRSQCNGTSFEREICNMHYCKNWSEWTNSTCSNPCGGERVHQRRCLDNGTLGDVECYKRTEACSDDAACKGDDVMDFLFLVDSTDHVDNCRKLRGDGFDVPVTSENIDNATTPVYFKTKQFMTQFVEGWNAPKSRVAIQLISGVCKSKTEEKLNLMRNFTEIGNDFANEVDSMPYLCGKFWLDWAIRCTTKNVLLPSRGDRPDVPTVVVALISYVPQQSRPSNFLLSALSQDLSNRGVPVVTASVTPPQQMSAVGRSKIREMLRTLSCRFGADCPLHIGSIWDNSRGSPSSRIREALSHYTFI